MLLIEKGNSSTMLGLTYEAPQKILNKGRGKKSMINTIGIDPDQITCYSISVLSGGSDLPTRRKNESIKNNTELVVTGDLPECYVRITPYLIGHIYNDRKYATLYPSNNRKLRVIREYRYKGVKIDIKDSKFDIFRKAPPKTKAPVKLYILDRIQEIRIGGYKYKVVSNTIESAVYKKVA